MEYARKTFAMIAQTKLQELNYYDTGSYIDNDFLGLFCKPNCFRFLQRAVLVSGCPNFDWNTILRMAKLLYSKKSLIEFILNVQKWKGSLEGFLECREILERNKVLRYFLMSSEKARIFKKDYFEEYQIAFYEDLRLEGDAN
jgi:hypothetical protein